MGCFDAQCLSFWVLGKEFQVDFEKIDVHMNKECFATTELCHLNVSFERCCLVSEPKLHLEMELCPNRPEE
jgi:hypothetical protein